MHFRKACGQATPVIPDLKLGHCTSTSVPLVTVDASSIPVWETALVIMYSQTLILTDSVCVEEKVCGCEET